MPSLASDLAPLRELLPDLTVEADELPPDEGALLTPALPILEFSLDE